MEENIKNNNRIELRRHLLFYLDITDLEKNESIGKLGDINNSGILLLLDFELKKNERLSLGINIPKSLKLDKELFKIQAEVRWCRKTQKPGMYEAGCLLSDLDSEAEAFIETLIGKIGFSDGTRRIFLQNEQNVFEEVDVTGNN